MKTLTGFLVVMATVGILSAGHPAAAFDPNSPNCGYYVNRDGHRVPRPCGNARTDPAPPRATAVCRDGSYSFSEHRGGTCSRHGGVASWR